MQLDGLTFVLEIVNFLVLVWILRRFLFGPVLQVVARRRAAIERTLADAGARQAQAEGLERQYRERLAEWEQEKERLRTKAIQEVETERARRIAMLKRTLDEERERHRAVEERREEEFRKRANQDAASRGLRFAARLLTRVAGAELEDRIVQVALEDLATLPGEQLQPLRAACRDGSHTAKVTSAYPLAAQRRDAIARGLCQAANAGISAEFDEDRSLLAGVRVHLGPWMLHANLRDELEFFAAAEQMDG